MAEKAKKRTVTIHEDQHDKDDVVVGVNGNLVQIKRGKPVDLEEPYIEALKNAKIHTIIKNPETGNESALTVPRFNLEVI